MRTEDRAKGFRFDCLGSGVELEGFEPSSGKLALLPIRPFPIRGLRLPQRRVRSSRSVFPEFQRSSPAASRLSVLSSALLLPGCADRAPRAIAGRCGSRPLPPAGV